MAKLKMFSVYDAKISMYMQPFFMVATGMALRGWETSVNDPQTNFHKYPSDFTLFEIGSFDESTGQVEMLKSWINLGSALEFKHKDASNVTVLDKKTS